MTSDESAIAAGAVIVIVVAAVVGWVLATGQPPDPGPRWEPVTGDLRVIRPEPGVVCYRASGNTLSCVREATP